MRVLNIVFALVALSFFTSPVNEVQAGVDKIEAEETASQETEPTDSKEDASSESTDSESDEAPPSIMDVPLDGSSVEAFQAGLARVDEEATEKQYRIVMSSLDYLLLYDIGAQRNKSRLYANLDGKSPNQIIQLARDERNAR